MSIGGFNQNTRMTNEVQLLGSRRVAKEVVKRLWQSKIRNSLNVFGTKKTFINDMPYAKIFDGTESKNEALDKSSYPGMKKGDLIPKFIESIRSGKKPTVNEIDIFRVMNICFAINESLETNQPVKVRYIV